MWGQSPHSPFLVMRGRNKPKERTAWKLATPIVGSDLWFIDSVCDAVYGGSADEPCQA
jgi:hypothetical protein